MEDRVTPAVSTLATFSLQQPVMIGGVSVQFNDHALAADAKGDLYGLGTTTGANPTGVIWELAAGQPSLKLLATSPLLSTGFDLISDSSGNLYGSTVLGGPPGAGEGGSIFALAAGSTSVREVCFLPQSGLDFVYAGSLTLVGDVLYGTTYAGGAHGDGSVFSVDVTGGTPTLFASFDGADGVDPNSRLAYSAGYLYGLTTGGGENGAGTVFSVPVNGSTITKLAGIWQIFPEI
jgi:uncharacterized repeat protein (TIGR03803 family)